MLFSSVELERECSEDIGKMRLKLWWTGLFGLMMLLHDSVRELFFALLASDVIESLSCQKMCKK